ALAQSLCERHHFANRVQFLQLKQTYETLWKNNIIPIANENDVVSNKELKFSDNDELATLIALGFDAEQLLFGTTVAGVLDKQQHVLSIVTTIDENVLALETKAKAAAGLGGMIYKLNFAKLAAGIGIRVGIFSVRENDSVLRAAQGATGTLGLPAEKRFS